MKMKCLAVGIILLFLLMTPSIVALENKQSSLITSVDTYENIFAIIRNVNFYTDYVSAHAIILIKTGLTEFEHTQYPIFSVYFNKDFQFPKPYTGIITNHFLIIHYDT